MRSSARGMPTCSHHLDRVFTCFLADIGIVDLHGFHDSVAQRMHRAEGSHRPLENHGDFFAVDTANLRTAGRQLRHIDDGTLAVYFPAGSGARDPPTTFPGGDGIMPMIAWAVTDLPEPLSPITPKVFPC